MKSVGLIFKITLALTLICTNVFSKNQNEKKDSFEKTYEISSSGNFSLNMYDSDVEIIVWDKIEVKIFGEIIFNGGDKEDEDKLLKAFRGIEVNSSANSLDINTEFIKSQVQIMGVSSKITLKTGDKISIEKVKTNYKVWMPATLAFTLKSKYNKVKIDNLKGDVKLNLYDVDIVMGNFGSTGNFDMKYSKANIGNGGNSTFMLYDTDIDAGELGNVKVDAKYSKLIIKKTNDLSIVSYDDDFVVGQLSKITADAKYSTFRLNGDTGDSKFELYDSDIFGKNFKSISFSAKYSDLRVGDIGELIIPSSYDNNYYLGIVGSLNCSESKYDMFRLDGANGSLDFPNSYDDDIYVKNTSANFKGLSGKFTYGKVYLKLDNSQQFNLNFSSTYGNITFPADKFKIKSLSDKTDSKRIFEGSTAADAKCNIKFTSYDTNFIIE